MRRFQYAECLLALITEEYPSVMGWPSPRLFTSLDSYIVAANWHRYYYISVLRSIYLAFTIVSLDCYIQPL